MAVSKREYARHLSSLSKSDEFAKGVRAYQRKHRIESYTEAAAEYAEKLEDEGSNLNRLVVFGEDPDAEETTSRAYSQIGKDYTRQEADIFLSELVQRRVDKGETMAEATEAIFGDPDLEHVVEIYNS